LSKKVSRRSIQRQHNLVRARSIYTNGGALSRTSA
jgi:hypothetical protein